MTVGLLACSTLDLKERFARSHSLSTTQKVRTPFLGVLA
jgi:hypothetical protein